MDGATKSGAVAGTDEQNPIQVARAIAEPTKQVFSLGLVLI
ncbi:MAG: hypothetical protein IPK04_11515 [Bdellovibrionales bacterium]|nr:hypothetical protein [Bdellovibrionales bacterium]